LAFIADAVGGDSVHVSLITPTGTEPHEYEPTTSQIMLAESADILLSIGGGLDPWAAKVSPTVLSHSGGVIVALDSVDEILSASKDQSRSGVTMGQKITPLDPHLWLDPIRMQLLASSLRDMLISADPAHRDSYITRTSALLQKLKTLHAEWQNGLAHCDLHDVIVAHNSFRYLANRYGLTTHALAGFSPEEEGSPANIAEIETLAKKLGLRDVFADSLISSQAVSAVAKDIGGQVVVLNPIEGLTGDDIAKERDYFTLMRENLSVLRHSLKCQ
jgi:zinc transport system substrate-binding protein